ncbi:hypothetical protein DL95DRAFT_470021 [Leptodontidium sp. 2 PMI_412]|nr:hypothetical protein DL95DRAFT_470021 [Leptodontidium sp. 2 PMI_412]
MSDFHQCPTMRMSQSPPQTPYSWTSTPKGPYRPSAYNRSVSPATPFTTFSTTTASSTSIKATHSVEVDNLFEDFSTPPAARLATQTSAYNEIVASIMDLPLEEWLTEAQAAVYKEQLRTQSGAEVLQAKFIEAFEAASKAQMLYADILRDCHSLDPNTHAFRIFKTWTLAKILYDQPEMATQLKIEVSNKGFNAGYTKVCEWIDIVAQDAEGTLEDIEIHCDQIDEYDLGEGINLRETLVAMEHYFENDYEDLCWIYPEYKTVPRAFSEEEGIISACGRPVRDKRTSGLD